RVGESLADLRRGYMQLVGKPLIPNRKLFGLWVSEFGYDDWAELDGVSQSLQKNGFPLDGMVMDLQWFGGIRDNSEDSSMGKLTWDESHFPDPAGKIKALAKQHIGLMLIEESYISRGLPEHKALQDKGFLVKQPDGKPVYLAKKPWWGKGGMIDWSKPRRRCLLARYQTPAVGGHGYSGALDGFGRTDGFCGGCGLPRFHAWQNHAFGFAQFV
ncbi:MAG: hypothetical protein BWK73_53845, partial [Thiothrix lacustris]